MRKFIRKLTCLVLAVLIPLTTSANWSTRTEEGTNKKWNAYAHNLEWNYDDYTLTVRKRPDNLVNSWYNYDDEDGTYGSNYRDEMLDYFARCTIAGWSDQGLLFQEVFGWVNFTLSLISLGMSFLTAYRTMPAGKVFHLSTGSSEMYAAEYATYVRPHVTWASSSSSAINLLASSPESVAQVAAKTPFYYFSLPHAYYVRTSYETLKVSYAAATAAATHLINHLVPVTTMWALAGTATLAGMSIEQSDKQRVLIRDQNPDGSATGGGGSIYGDANSGCWLHYLKSPWQLDGIADKIKKVVIEEGITVGTHAFTQLSNLRVVHAKRGVHLKNLSFYECPSLSYVYIDNDLLYDESEGGIFPNTSPRKTTYVVNGKMEQFNRATYSLGASSWTIPTMPYFDICGLYAESFRTGYNTGGSDVLESITDRVGKEYKKYLYKIEDYSIPLGIKTSKKSYEISRLRPADVSVKYEFKEGTENRPLMPNPQANTTKDPNFINYLFKNSEKIMAIDSNYACITYENQDMIIDSINILSVKDGGYPDGSLFKLSIFQEAPSVIDIKDDKLSAILEYEKGEYMGIPTFDDYGFHTVVKVTAYDDDTYRENDIPTGTVEEDLTGNDNLFKIHNLNANGKAIITTAAQQDAIQKGGWDEVTVYANADANTPKYILNFTSPATKVKINGEDRYYINGKLSERQYGEDLVISPKTIWTDEKGNLQYAKEGEIYYDEVNVAANWGVDWNYRIKTIMYSKKTNLESLSVDGLQLYPPFRKDVYDYDIYSDMDPNHWRRVDAAISNPWSTNVVHRNSGDKYEIVINNKITGDSSKYTIRLNSTVPKLNKLSVDGKPIDLTNGWLDYEIEVDVLDTNTPIIYEPAENSKVVDYGWDLTEMAEGRITYIITVKTQTHEERTYKIVFFKDMPVEEERQLKYSIETSGDLYVGRKYNVKVVPEDRTVMTIGNGEYTLKYGVNEFKITLRKGDIKEYVYTTVNVDYSYYNGTKMTRGTTPDSTTTVTLFGNIQSDKDWNTEYFDLTKKLVIYCGKYTINTKIPKNSAQIIELRDAAVLPNNFLGDCKQLKELHLFQQPWQIDEGVFWNPEKMTIRTHGEYVNKYKSFRVWKEIGQILPFEGEEVTEEENVETGIDEVGTDERVVIYNVYGKYLGITERRNRKIVIPAWLGHGVFVAKGSKYVEKFVNKY